ncbi:hypothetical protein RA280_14300 [Cupriavidus sp. CV2]|uniref:hypothetical protein n=1 Tax=Cupriavidus ulmosensis TaxID=3065913 RepID=UPI00296ACE78|nr:hypothetical protein [Cupriavidus sp. CV2]MDW3682897.1 hypothetical protein [Cupriavidus sp. CV2]
MEDDHVGDQLVVLDIALARLRKYAALGTIRCKLSSSLEAGAAIRVLKKLDSLDKSMGCQRYGGFFSNPADPQLEAERQAHAAAKLRAALAVVSSPGQPERGEGGD